MKLKISILALVAGFFLTLFGALFKLESREGSSEMLVAGLAVQMIGIIGVVLNALKKQMTD